MLKINRISILLFSYLINNYLQLLSNQAPLIINNLTHDEFMLHSPLRFTTTGINNFLNYTYNHPKYASEILPHNTGHFLQLLEHGQNTKQDSDYILAVLRLLRQKISGTEYMSAAELERITGLTPAILADYLNPKGKNFQKNNCCKIKNLLVHIIENCLNKTIWDCCEPELITKQIIKIGQNLENLTQLKIIEDLEDLNDLIHCLIDRFIYVLSISQSEQPASFYEELSKQLHSASWMNLTEIETGIDTKLKKIDQAFLKNQIQSAAAKNFGV